MIIAINFKVYKFERGLIGLVLWKRIRSVMILTTMGKRLGIWDAFHLIKYERGMSVDGSCYVHSNHYNTAINT